MKHIINLLLFFFLKKKRVGISRRGPDFYQVLELARLHT